MDDTQNVAETVRDIMKTTAAPVRLPVGNIYDETGLCQIAVPEHMKVVDLTEDLHRLAERDRPQRRRGTDTLTTLDALIGWANRFTDSETPSAALFADLGADRFAPSLTCITNWNLPGAADTEGQDEGAQHGDHRGVYRFPLSPEWQDWTALEGKMFSKDEMGEFIELHMKDILDPTPPLLGTGVPNDWEKEMIEIASRLDGRFASYRQLLEMSRKFAATEATDWKLVSNRDTGEHLIETREEHRDEQGAPIRIPNLFMIAIPVFDGDAVYRLPVRLHYRLKGGLKFFLAVHDTRTIARHAFDQAITRAQGETKLPLFMGRA